MKENKHKNLCPWYDKYQVDDKGKILNTQENVLTFFLNYPKFGKFSIDESTGYETYNNEIITYKHMAKFYKICKQELGFCSKRKINIAIKALANNEYNISLDYIAKVIRENLKQ